MRSLFSGLALVLTLSACAGEVSITHNEVPRAGVPSHADYAASLGPTPVVMLNNPFPPATVVAALQRNNARQHLVFSTDPPASLKGGYRVLLAFDGIPGGGMQVCRDPFGSDTPPAARLSPTSVYGAFCLGPTLLSEAVASAPRLGGPTDPRLGRVMGDLLVALMPLRDPHQNSRGLCVQPC
jgi:hypothetical protein